MIADMERELEKVRKARVKPGYHIDFVTGDINDTIKKKYYFRIIAFYNS